MSKPVRAPATTEQRCQTSDGPCELIDALLQFCISLTPAGFAVHRWQTCSLAMLHKESEPMAVEPTIEAARAAIPAGYLPMDQHAYHDPTILEIWI